MLIPKYIIIPIPFSQIRLPIYLPNTPNTLHSEPFYEL
jgi:hypothetical protein